MKTLVTGGAGFIGSHLCKSLLESGSTVISLDNYFTGSRNNHIPGVEYREGHTKNISQHIPEKVDLIFHLGEYSRVEKSFEEPDTVWDLNVAGTFGVLEYWRKHRCKLIYAGSSTKFADHKNGKTQSPYAWTKAINAEFITNYGAWYDLPFVICYFYNVYGPGERAGAYGTVIEIFKQQYLSNKPLTIVKPGTQKRIFTHVEDIINGLMLVGSKGNGDGFGLGAKRAYSIIEIAHLFRCPITMIPERTGNRTSSPINTKKSYALGWRPKHNVKDYIGYIISKGSKL